jgi:tetratricopeptide (TPR) repeat protein/GTP-binding protein EngB required for normal cell division
MSLWSRLERRLGDLADEIVLDDYRDQLAQARQLLARGDVQTATDMLEALLRAKPDHGQALLVLGDARLANRDPARAHAAYERALALRSGDPAALVGVGLALVSLARFEAAIEPLARAVTEAAGDRALLADAYRGLGIAWRRRDELDKAIRELRKAVVEDGDDLDARAALGEAIVADGGVNDEALRHLERASATEQPPAVGLYALGLLALREGVPALASQHLARARELADADPTPYGVIVRRDILVAQGDATSAQGDATTALELFAAALALDPKRAQIHGKLAGAHAQLGNFQAALQAYDRALALGCDLGVLRTAVDCALAAHDATRELTWGSDLLSRSPDDVRALVARGAGLVREQPEVARALLELAAARDDVDAHLELARLELARSEPGVAASHALAALRVSPHHAGARALLADARSAALSLPPGDDIGELAACAERALAGHSGLAHLIGGVSRAVAALDTPLLVTVMGEFSSGKSSFVNAFIGADVAPTGITPTTATINVVRYGRERGGRIYGRDGGVQELGWDALMIRLRQLSPEEAHAIDRVEILVPLPQLEKIHIVDTPGLNSILPEHEATARAFIARADAVVWVFTASQGGKASEQRALRAIRDEGKRVLGVLNKADQLQAAEIAEVAEFIGSTFRDQVETIVPVSARNALAWKQAGGTEDGGWKAVLDALEQYFFRQARQLKRDACTRSLRTALGSATSIIDAQRTRMTAAADSARATRDQLADSANELCETMVVAERRSLSEASVQLYRRAAREVLDLVRPRRLPFSSHTATVADRDYLVALLVSGFDSAIVASRDRVAAILTARARDTDLAARTLATALELDVAGDLERVAADQVGLASSRVFERAQAYVRGYLDGGYVEAFFRNDIPKLDLAEDAIYHALYRAAPDLDREIGLPLARAFREALTALAARVAHWGAVVDVQILDLEVGLAHALTSIAARL